MSHDDDGLFIHVDLPFSLLPKFHAPIWQHPAIVDMFLDTVRTVFERRLLFHAFFSLTNQYQSNGSHEEELAPASDNVTVTLDVFAHLLTKQSEDKQCEGAQKSLFFVLFVIGFSAASNAERCKAALPLFERAAELSRQLHTVAAASTMTEVQLVVLRVFRIFIFRCRANSAVS